MVLTATNPYLLSPKYVNAALLFVNRNERVGLRFAFISSYNWLQSAGGVNPLRKNKWSHVKEHSTFLDEKCVSSKKPQLNAHNKVTRPMGLYH